MKLVVGLVAVAVEEEAVVVVVVKVAEPVEVMAVAAEVRYYDSHNSWTATAELAW